MRAGRMMARGAGRLLAVGLLAAAPGLAAAAEVSAAGAPRRVVSLDLCTDWLLARYAPRGQVAALSPLNRRYRVDWLDASWPVHDGSIEGILQLRPDLVITGQYNAVQLRKRLAALGVRVEVLPLPTGLDQLAGYEARLLGWLGLPSVPAAQHPDADAGTDAGPRLLLLGANGIGTGRGTFEDGILARAGWTNYVRAPGYLRLDLEQVAADPPDAILWAAPDQAALANRYAEHPVLKRAVPAARWLSTDYWRWQCPGPWTWELVDELHRELPR